MNRPRQNNAWIIAISAGLTCVASLAVAAPLPAGLRSSCLPEASIDQDGNLQASLAALESEGVRLRSQAVAPSIPSARITDPDVVQMLSRAPRTPTQADLAQTEAFARAIRARASPPPRNR